MADIIPERPGLEIAYGYEDRQAIYGIQVADARTGEMIWGHPIRPCIFTTGACLPTSMPGIRLRVLCRRTEARARPVPYSARDGKLLSTADLGSITLNPVYWLDGPQKVYNVFSYRGTTTVLQKYKMRRRWTRSKDRSSPSPTWSATGARIHSDGDGPLRIATTTVPSSSRHVTLMQDALYRNDVAHASMGYFYPPIRALRFSLSVQVELQRRGAATPTTPGTILLKTISQWPRRLRALGSKTLERHSRAYPDITRLHDRARVDVVQHHERRLVAGRASRCLNQQRVVGRVQRLDPDLNPNPIADRKFFVKPKSSRWWFMKLTLGKVVGNCGCSTARAGLSVAGNVIVCPAALRNG